MNKNSAADQQLKVSNFVSTFYYSIILYTPYQYYDGSTRKVLKSLKMNSSRDTYNGVCKWDVAGDDF